MSELEAELLEVFALQADRVEYDVVMRWVHRALRDVLRDKVEVEPFINKFRYNKKIKNAIQQL